VKHKSSKVRGATMKHKSSKIGGATKERKKHKGAIERWGPS